jgi:hypothetical protein
VSPSNESFASADGVAYPERLMARDDDDDDRGSGSTTTLIKGGLFALGAMAAVYWVLWPLFIMGWVLAKSAIFLAALAGAGYIGYRMIAGGGGERRALRGRRGQKALGTGRRGSRGSGDDFDRKMRELDAIEKRLDAEIGKR